MIKIISINYNETVSVKLTKYGQQILNNYSSIIYCNADKDGYHNFPLWKLMNIFGEVTYFGNPNIVFESDLVFRR